MLQLEREIEVFWLMRTFYFKNRVFDAFLRV